MAPEIYPLLRRAERIVMATPIFFYGVPAQLKALIDRCQVLWARRYRLKLHDPAAHQRRGFLLALGATKGKNLFEGVSLTARYFFDAIDAEFDGSLTYRQMEEPGDMAAHPTVLQDVRQEAARLIGPCRDRTPVVFACRENACRSQMAAAFAQYLAGDTIEALSAGSTPARQINPLMVEVMAEKGLDLAFRTPHALDDILTKVTPRLLITMGCGEACPFIPGMKRIDWDLPDPAGQPIEFMRKVRDDIEGRVKELMRSFP
jgi:protein-tyrosine-phosphatase